MTPLVVAVCTRNRAQGLRRLLSGLAEVDVPADASIRLLIVDNGDVPLDAMSLPSNVPWPTDVVTIPEPGLARVRNAALAGRRRAEALIFIDDDEVPSRQWLRELVKASAHHPTSIIAGPVTRKDEQSGRELWASPTARDGDVVAQSGFGNILIPAAVLDGHPDLSFDPRFDRSGGEDTDFVFQARRRGITIRWAAAAECVEFRPATRETRRQQLRRIFVQAAIYSCVLRTNREGVNRRLIISMARLTVGPWWFLLSTVVKRASFVAAGKMLASGAGGLMGLLLRTPPAR